ncbi:MAG TPA: hypothetical protein VNY77_00920 [Candidatus Angelobacter sp.]|nr:hypothetical protein [Candidatus Angelobacter sp.]
MILSDAHAARPGAGGSTAAGGVGMSLDSYEPNRTGYETSLRSRLPGV